MVLERKSANARRDLQHGNSPTFVQKREILALKDFNTRKSKAFEGHYLSTPTNRSRGVHVWPVLTSSSVTFNGLGEAVNPRGYCP